MNAPITALTYFPRPDLTEKVAKVVASGLATAITLFAPRRRGKTLFVKNEVQPWAENAGWNVVYIDLWADREAPEMALVRGLEKAHRKSWIAGKLKKVSVKGKTPVGDLEAEFDERHEADAGEKPEMRLAEAMNALVKQSGYVFLILDEFQALAGTHRESFVAAFRTVLLKHGAKVFVLYTGSSRERLLSMFRAQRAPLFDSAFAIDLPDLGDDFLEDRAAFLAQRMRARISKKALATAFDQASHSPEALNNIVLRILINNDGNVQRAQQEWAESVAAEFRPARWESLSALERLLLCEIAAGRSRGLTSRERVATFGRDASINKVIAALRRLQRTNWIESGGARGEYAVVDPDTAEYLRRA